LDVLDDVHYAQLGCSGSDIEVDIGAQRISETLGVTSFAAYGRAAESGRRPQYSNWGSSPTIDGICDARRFHTGS
jgi:hypothetical protein